MKLYNDQRNAQVLKFIYQFTSALHVSGFLLVHLQRQVYNFGVVRTLLGQYPLPEKADYISVFWYSKIILDSKAMQKIIVYSLKVSPSVKTISHTVSKCMELPCCFH
jgi:hypothetical protein